MVRDKRGDKQEAAEFHDRPLLLLFFFGIQPLAKQFRILRHHDQAGAEHRHEQNAHQQPSLPILQRPRRQEEQQADDDNPEQKLAEGLQEEFILVHSRF